MKLFDTGGTPGLFHLITPGARGWRLRYYRDGREKLVSVGPWPEVSLTEARHRAKALRKQIDSGADPSEERKRVAAADIEGRAKTFGVVGTELCWP
jgi:hypothetical protein